MSDMLRERVFVMPPMSRASLEVLAETVLAQFQPSALQRPEPIAVVEWIDVLLPRFGVNVTPATADELGDCAAATYPPGQCDSECRIPQESGPDHVNSDRQNVP